MDIRGLLYKYFHVVFLGIFGWVFLNILLNNTYYVFTPVLISFCSALFICILYNFHRKLKDIGELQLKKLEKIIVPIFFMVLFSIQLVFGIALETVPGWDFEAVFKGAQTLAFDGNIAGREDYFYKFPNNLGGTVFLSIIFKLTSFLDIQNFHILATVFNIIIMQLSIFLAYLIAKRLFGIERAFCVLFFCFFIPSFYFFSPLYYTDSLSMIFPVLIYYIYLKTKSIGYKWKLPLLAVLGIVSLFGLKVKAPVVIALIAVFIEYCLTCDRKNCIKKISLYTTPVLMGFIIANVLFNAFVSSYMLPSKERMWNETTPYSHWIMMGLNGNGGYSWDDYVYTDSFSNVDEKHQADMIVIKERLIKIFSEGYTNFFTNKAVYIWGDGTYNAENFLRTNPVNHTVLHEMILLNGKYRNQFSIYSQIILISLLFLILSAAYFNIKKGNNNNSGTLIAIFGLFLFTLAWESNPRILVNYIPVYVLAAMGGLEYFYQKRLCKKGGQISESMP